MESRCFAHGLIELKKVILVVISRLPEGAFAPGEGVARVLLDVDAVSQPELEVFDSLLVLEQHLRVFDVLQLEAQAPDVNAVDLLFAFGDNTAAAVVACPDELNPS